jgi:hypothetical protein
MLKPKLSDLRTLSDRELGTRARGALKRTHETRAGWLDATIELATLIAEGRRRHLANDAFSRWLDANGLGSIGHSDRAALVTLGRKPRQARKFFEANPECSSWRVAHNELKRLENRQASSQTGNSQEQKSAQDAQSNVVNLDDRRTQGQPSDEGHESDELDAADGDADRRQEFDAARSERGYASAIVDGLHNLSAAIEHTDFEKARAYEVNSRGDRPLTHDEIRRVATWLNGFADFVEQRTVCAETADA